jgi:hypothetical protein
MPGAVARIGGGLLHGEINKQGAEQIEDGKEVEIGGEPEMVGDTGRDQPADQIARHVAGDVGGEGRRRILRAVMLAEIGKRQGEGRRHAQALHHAQDGKDGEVGRVGEERRRDRQQDEADQDAAAPVDAAREISDGETGDEHAEGARIGARPICPGVTP